MDRFTQFGSGASLHREETDSQSVSQTRPRPAIRLDGSLSFLHHSSRAGSPRSGPASPLISAASNATLFATRDVNANGQTGPCKSLSAQRSRAVSNSLQAHHHHHHPYQHHHINSSKSNRSARSKESDNALADPATTIPSHSLSLSLGSSRHNSRHNSQQRRRQGATAATLSVASPHGAEDAPLISEAMEALFESEATQLARPSTPREPRADQDNETERQRAASPHPSHPARSGSAEDVSVDGAWGTTGGRWQPTTSPPPRMAVTLSADFTGVFSGSRSRPTTEGQSVAEDRVRSTAAVDEAGRRAVGPVDHDALAASIGGFSNTSGVSTFHAPWATAVERRADSSTTPEAIGGGSESMGSSRSRTHSTTPPPRRAFVLSRRCSIASAVAGAADTVESTRATTEVSQSTAVDVENRTEEVKGAGEHAEMAQPRSQQQQQQQHDSVSAPSSPIISPHKASEDIAQEPHLQKQHSEDASLLVTAADARGSAVLVMGVVADCREDGAGNSSGSFAWPRRAGRERDRRRRRSAGVDVKEAKAPTNVLRAAEEKTPAEDIEPVEAMPHVPAAEHQFEHAVMATDEKQALSKAAVLTPPPQLQEQHPSPKFACAESEDAAAASMLLTAQPRPSTGMRLSAYVEGGSGRSSDSLMSPLPRPVAASHAAMAHRRPNLSPAHAREEEGESEEKEDLSAGADAAMLPSQQNLSAAEETAEEGHRGAVAGAGQKLSDETKMDRVPSQHATSHQDATHDVVANKEVEGVAEARQGGHAEGEGAVRHVGATSSSSTPSVTRTTTATVASSTTGMSSLWLVNGPTPTPLRRLRGDEEEEEEEEGENEEKTKNKHTEADKMETIRWDNAGLQTDSHGASPFPETEMEKDEESHHTSNLHTAHTARTHVAVKSPAKWEEEGEDGQALVPTPLPITLTDATSSHATSPQRSAALSLLSSEDEGRDANTDAHNKCTLTTTTQLNGAQNKLLPREDEDSCSPEPQRPQGATTATVVVTAAAAATAVTPPVSLASLTASISPVPTRDQQARRHQHQLLHHQTHHTDYALKVHEVGLTPESSTHTVLRDRTDLSALPNAEASAKANTHTPLDLELMQPSLSLSTTPLRGINGDGVALRPAATTTAATANASTPPSPASTSSLRQSARVSEEVRELMERAQAEVHRTRASLLATLRKHRADFHLRSSSSDDDDDSGRASEGNEVRNEEGGGEGKDAHAVLPQTQEMPFHTSTSLHNGREEESATHSAAMTPRAAHLTPTRSLLLPKVDSTTEKTKASETARQADSPTPDAVTPHRTTAAHACTSAGRTSGEVRSAATALRPQLVEAADAILRRLQGYDARGHGVLPMETVLRVTYFVLTRRRMPALTWTLRTPTGAVASTPLRAAMTAAAPRTATTSTVSHHLTSATPRVQDVLRGGATSAYSTPYQQRLSDRQSSGAMGLKRGRSGDGALSSPFSSSPATRPARGTPATEINEVPRATPSLSDYSATYPSPSRTLEQVVAHQQRRAEEESYLNFYLTVLEAFKQVFGERYAWRHLGATNASRHDSSVVKRARAERPPHAESKPQVPQEQTDKFSGVRHNDERGDSNGATVAEESAELVVENELNDVSGPLETVFPRLRQQYALSQGGGKAPSSSMGFAQRPPPLDVLVYYHTYVDSLREL